MNTTSGLRKGPFLLGVFLITFSLLIFQILQTRILSVIAWYYLAFFAISVAMLGMTVGAVWVYLWRELLQSTPLPLTLSQIRAALGGGHAGVGGGPILPGDVGRAFRCRRSSRGHCC